MFLVEWWTYKHIGCGIIITSAGGGKANSGSKIRDIIGRIKVGWYGRFKAISLGSEIGGETAITKTAGCAAAREVTTIRLEIGSGHC